ncbi:MAG: ATP-binding cassette domain-containing protein [Chloroflexaceae bacterium]|nr:ATP-binding cassette domain-containing protein [Chloroflexaceae bacterium]
MRVSALTKRSNRRRRFRAPISFIHAVDDLSFSIQRGSNLALVGESGSGKTTTGKLLVRLLDPSAGSVQMHFDAP